MIDPASLARIRAETPGIGRGVHLMACGASLMPAPVVDEVIRFTRLEAEIGGYEAAEAEAGALEAVYDKIAAHIGAKPHEIAIVENATVAWCQAFYALPMAPGSRILTAEAEYAANYLAFLQRARRDGVKIDVVPSDATGALDTSALEAMIGPDVALIAVTWVPTNGGLVNPAAQIGRIARRHGVPYLLDACQAAGQMPIDVGEIGCDFLSATGRKFLRGPRGTGFLYVRDEWLGRLEPVMVDLFSAHWVARDAYELRSDARRFETWENAYALRAGLGAAFDYMDAIGIEAIEARVTALARLMRERLAAIPRATVRDLGRRPCGIVSFDLARLDADAVVAAMRADGFVLGTSTPASTRIDAERRHLPTLVRLAPHYYNTEDEIAACADALARIAA